MAARDNFVLMAERRMHFVAVTGIVPNTALQPVDEPEHETRDRENNTRQPVAKAAKGQDAVQARESTRKLA